jgi:tripartite-type tricarboxylate transporter receptor subunit TctC
VKDFAPVVLAATAPNILDATPGLPANSLRELIALAKANPGKLNAASPGKGTTLHLAAEMLKSVAVIDFAIIHYKGAQPAMNALLSGEVGFMFDAGTVIPHVNAGKLKAFAVTSPKRSVALPEQPTMAQAGLPGFEVVSWYGFLAPGATPRRFVEALNREINGVLSEADARERILKIGLEPASSTPEELDQFIREQIARWGKVIETSGVKSE